MFRLSRKLKVANNYIRSFGKLNYSDLEKRVIEAHNLLLLRQKKTLADSNQFNAALKLEARTKWHPLSEPKKAFFAKDLV